ncbi:MAG: thiolase family protein [Candidatus Hydrogenedentes bacterium]|nr:thiolase family protein [Candidatus Hydrogenedentota bacterium]
MNNVYVVSAKRTAVGKSGRGVLRLTRPDDLAAFAIKGAVDAAGIDPAAIDDVVIGCATPEAEQGMNVARIALLRAGLPQSVSGLTINRFCSSGTEALAIAAAKIECGMLDVAVAGGTESMSMVGGGGNKVTPNPTLAEELPEIFIAMGNCGDNVARDFNITREQADAWGARSQQRAGAAVAAGKFKDEIVPVEVRTPDGGTFTFDTDEGPRPETTAEVLAGLRLAFAASHDRGVCTAGNSSQTSDGAAACVLASGEAVKRHGLKPLGKMRAWCVQAGDPKYLGPPQVPAIKKACEQAGIKPEDLGLVECNEAFATQTIHVVREMGFSEDIVNVNGGAIALGHPLGCTGAKLVATLLHEMKRRNVKYGLITMCIGGGMGGAGIFELCE